LYSPYCIYELYKLIDSREKLMLVYLEETVEMQKLLNTAQKYWNFFDIKTIPSWLANEFKTIDTTDVLKKLSNLTDVKYVSFEDIISKDGKQKFLNFLQYTPESYINMLDGILKIDDFYERELEFDKYLNIATSNEVFNYYKALSYEMQGYIEGAKFYLDQAIKINPQYVIPYIKLITLSIEYPKKVILDSSIFETLEKQSIVLNSEKALIHKAKGILCFREGQKTEDHIIKKSLFDKALLHYQAANRYSDFKDETIYNNMAQIYEQLGNIKEALYAYKEAISLFPHYYQALNNLALLFDKFFNDKKTAKDIYEKCLEIAPNYTLAQSNYALLMENFDLTTSVKTYFEILCNDHNKTDYITNLALIFEEENISGEIAKTLYQICLNIKPYSVPARFNMANYLRRNGEDFETVLEHLKYVNEHEPQNTMILITFALLYLREDNIHIALQYCEDTLTISPEYIPAIFLKAMILEKMKESPQSIIEYLNNKIRVLKSKLLEEEEKQLCLLYNMLFILYKKIGKTVLSQKYQKKVYMLDGRFCKLIEKRDIYGMSILEYDYPKMSNERIYKNRILNLSIDDHKQTLKHIKKMLGLNE